MGQAAGFCIFIALVFLGIFAYFHWKTTAIRKDRLDVIANIDDMNIYSYRADISFTVEETIYCNSISLDKDDVVHYRPGDKITIYCLKHNPSYIIKDLHSPMHYLALALAVLMVITAMILYAA